MIVSIEDVRDRVTELAERVESGDVVVVTRDGKPVFDLAPHKPPRGGLDFAAAEAYLRDHGIVRKPGFMADDFNDPLPEDFLIRPFPEL